MASIILLCHFPLFSTANELGQQQLNQQADQFLANYKQQKYSVEELDELELNSQKLIKKLQACEKKAEQEISQLTEIRQIEALNTSSNESTEQGDKKLPQDAATQEVDRQINGSTKRLISCRLKSAQMEAARLSILEQKQQLWVDELTSRQDVWSFIGKTDWQMDHQSFNQVLPINKWFLLTVLLGMSGYLTVVWIKRNQWFNFNSPELEAVDLKLYFKQLFTLHIIPVALAVAYFFWVDSNKIHALVLSGGLLVRDACVLLPLKLLIKAEKKPLVIRFILVSTVLMVLLAIGWNGINFKQNFGLGWLSDYAVIITPLVIITCVLFGLTNWYFYQLLMAYKDRFIPRVMTFTAGISLLTYALTYAQGSQYLLIVSVGLMLVHWLLKTINSVRKVLLTHKITRLKQYDNYDGSNFSFPFWSSLLTVIISGLAGLVFLSWLVGFSEEAYKQVTFIFSEGFNLGSVRIVPQDILIAVSIVALIIYTIQKLKFGIENRWFNKSRVRESSREVFSMLVWYIGLTIAIFVGLSVAGFDISNLAIIAGALSVGIGFGLQNIVSNFVSGLILLFERPVTRGDWVEVGDTVGLIEKVKIRATRIRTFDNAEILVPNSELLSHHVTNWTLSNSIGRITLKVGVAYGSDVNQVRDILNAMATNHEQVMQRDPYKHKVLFRAFGDSSLNFELRVMIKNIKLFLDVESDLNFAIDKAFRDAGISIPFPQRDLHIKDSAVLKVDAPEQETDENESQDEMGESEYKQDETTKERDENIKQKSEQQTQSNNQGSSASDKDEVEQMIEEDEKREKDQQKAAEEEAKEKSEQKKNHKSKL